MSRVSQLGKEITIAVKRAAPIRRLTHAYEYLFSNPRKYAQRQRRKGNKATDKDSSDYKEVVYEGYGPYGIAIVVETATDNTTHSATYVATSINMVAH